MAVTTIILPVSRTDYLDRIFAQLEMLDCVREETNLFVYVDGNWPIFEKARNLTYNSKFADRQCVYRNRGLTGTSSFKRRRKRIADIHNEIREQVGHSEYAMLIEDDTLFPLFTLERFLSAMALNPYTGLISGVEIGRWGFAHIGAWEFDDVYEPTRIISSPLTTGVREVDATGLYCCLTKMKNYKAYTFEPYDTILGPDVAYGIYLRHFGLKNYIDYSVACTHMTKKGDLKMNIEPIDQVRFSKNATSWTQQVV